MRFFFFAVLPLFFFSVNSFAQDPEPLTLDRLWYSGEFRQEGFRSAGWYQGGDWYITTEKPKEFSGTNFILNNCRSGKTKTLLAAEKLIPESRLRLEKRNNWFKNSIEDFQKKTS